LLLFFIGCIVGIVKRVGILCLLTMSFIFVSKSDAVPV